MFVGEVLSARMKQYNPKERNYVDGANIGGF